MCPSPGTHHYLAYGLHLETPFPCPELREYDGRPLPRVAVRYGSLVVPDEFGNEAAYRTRREEVLLRVPGVGTYLISDGQEIVIDPVEDAEESAVRLFLLGSCLAALLQQLGLLTIHASAIRTARGAVLFAGPQGIGKSTLAHHFWSHGHTLVTDDVAAVEDDGTGLVVRAGYPQAKLWIDALRQVGVRHESLRRVRAAEPKFALPLEERFTHGPIPLAAVVLLDVHGGDSFTYSSLAPVEAFDALLGLTYRNEFLFGQGLLAEHFELLTRVVRSVPIGRVSRPEKGFQLADLAETIGRNVDVTT